MNTIPLPQLHAWLAGALILWGYIFHGVYMVLPFYPLVPGNDSLPRGRGKRASPKSYSRAD